jgi:hypothetical protein
MKINGNRAKNLICLLKYDKHIHYTFIVKNLSTISNVKMYYSPFF